MNTIRHRASGGACARSAGRRAPTTVVYIRRQRGRKIPELLVAAAAEALNLIVLHYDADFDQISTVTGQPHQWAVPAGTVD